MGKLKQPLLSLGARGTLGDEITFSEPRSRSLVRKKPIPSYTNTLAQQYQRWDYLDALYYWHSLTQVEKDAYRVEASRRHIPLLATVVSYYLRNLPDLAGRWRLDTPVQATTPDSSKQGNTGTVFGASPAVGDIDGSFLFDGINDQVTIPNDPSLVITTAMTLEFFFTRHTGVGPNPGYVTHWASWIMMHSLPGAVPLFRCYTDIGNCQRDAPAALPLGEKHHITATYLQAPPGIHLFRDGLPWDGALPAANYGTLTVSANDLYIALLFAGNYMPATIDHVALYTRVLSDAQILNHALRRWP